MKKLQKGFTLIELMIVVAIIAILAAVAAPRFAIQLTKAQDAKGIAIIGAVRSAATTRYADLDGKGPGTIDELEEFIDVKSWGKIDKFTSGASVEVGVNTADGKKDGTVIAKVEGTGNLAYNQVEITAPNVGDGGTVDITGTGLDAKGTSWSAY